MRTMKGLAHVCFVVSDLERSLEFYRDGLGLKQAFELTLNDGEVKGLYFHVGGRTFIELFQGSPAPVPPDVSYRHFCLEVADIEKTVAALRRRGVEVSEIKTGNDNSYQAWITDPDGNRIELHQYTRRSLQNGALEEAGRRSQEEDPSATDL
jgi:catechol 2,3-dioxygenase-like lactoylglutathione lyase family enzyme